MLLSCDFKTTLVMPTKSWSETLVQRSHDIANIMQITDFVDQRIAQKLPDSLSSVHMRPGLST